MDYEETLLSVALNAPSTDCAVAFERANKGFLLSGKSSFISAARTIKKRLADAGSTSTIEDIERLKREIETFIRQAQKAVPRSRLPKK